MQATGNMARIKSAMLAVLLLSAPGFAMPALASGPYLPDSSVATAQHIIQHTTRQNYAHALALCHLLQQRHPEHPVGYFFEAATLQARMLDFEDYSEQKTFFALSKKVVSLCRTLLVKQPENSLLYFFWGAALGYEAYFQGKDNHMLQAFRGGWDSIQLLERALALDPGNYDVYLGIGAYKYYRSKYSHFLKWLPFVHDERQAGIEMIRQAIDNGLFARPAALNALIWIYVEEKHYEAAQELVDRALADYPGSRFFLWGKARVAQLREDWPAAAAAYREILRSYAEDGKQVPVNELICYAGLAECARAEGDAASAIELARRALAIEVPSSGRKKVEPYRDEAKKLLRELGAR